MVAPIPKPLFVGSLSVWPPILLAPMAGFTDSVFRDILREHGCPYAYTEMISAQGLIMSGDNSKGLLVHSRADDPLAVQIFGHEPSVMAKAAEVLQNGTYGEFGVVDINMGCPARKITAPGSGGALLRNLPLARDIVVAVKEVCRIPVTVKTRLGWDGGKDPCEVAEMFQRAGADMLVVHGRTVTEGYSGTADWDAISRMAQSVDVPVVGNGDIRTPQDALAKATLPGLSGVMVGRGALTDPLFFRHCIDILEGKTVSGSVVQERLNIAKEHLERAMVFYGERRGLLNMRKHFAYYLRGVKNAAAYRDMLNHELNPQRILEILDSASL